MHMCIHLCVCADVHNMAHFLVENVFMDSSAKQSVSRLLNAVPQEIDAASVSCITRKRLCCSSLPHVDIPPRPEPQNHALPGHWTLAWGALGAPPNTAYGHAWPRLTRPTLDARLGGPHMPLAQYSLYGLAVHSDAKPADFARLARVILDLTEPQEHVGDLRDFNSQAARRRMELRSRTLGTRTALPPRTPTTTSS